MNDIPTTHADSNRPTVQRIMHRAHSLPPQSVADVGRPSAGLVGHHLPVRPFVPTAPLSLEELGLGPRQVESLVLKFLLSTGEATGRDIAAQLALPFGIVEGLLRQMKVDQWVVLSAGTPVGDYVYQLTEAGTLRARADVQQCSYHGSAPVPLEEYLHAVRRQSVRKHALGLAEVQRAFADLVLSDQQLDRIGEALSAGQAFFVYGAPGNGKTSLAQRVSSVLGDALWIPRAIQLGDQIVRLFDPSCHQELPLSPDEHNDAEPGVDRRWVRIRRPTLVAGSELTLDRLEVAFNPRTGVCEAPIQLKSNGGTLVIDDLGRQRFQPDELFNRWITPLEQGVDILNVPGGRSFVVPFDPLLVFVTRQDPAQLVDESFLRRVSYKIRVEDPSDAQFRELFARAAGQLGIDYDQDTLEYLLEVHFRGPGRPVRFCHPGNLLQHVRNYCRFRQLPLALTRQAVDAAAGSYFTAAADVAASGAGGHRG